MTTYFAFFLLLCPISRALGSSPYGDGRYHHYPYHHGDCGFNEFHDTPQTRKLAYRPDDPGPHSISFPSHGRGMDGYLLCAWKIDPGAPWNAIQLRFTELELSGENRVEVHTEKGLIDNFYGDSERAHYAITGPVGQQLSVKLHASSENENDKFTIEFFRFQAAMWSGSTMIGQCDDCQGKPCFYDINTHSCFILHGADGEMKTFDDAFYECGPRGHLAIVRDRETFDRLAEHFHEYAHENKKHLDKHYEGPWVGLKQIKENNFDDCDLEECWFWILPIGKQWPAPYGKTPWKEGEPNGDRFPDRGANCGALFYEREYYESMSGLNDHYCSRQQQYLCQEEHFAACPEIFHEYDEDENGTIASPRWPSPFPPNLRCYYVIWSKARRDIKLVLNSLDFIHSDSKVEIFERHHVQRGYEFNRLKVWDKNTVVPDTVASESEEIVVIFDGGSNTARKFATGFSATYSDIAIVKCECQRKGSHTLPSDGQWMIIDQLSHNPNVRYCGDVTCNSTVHAQAGSAIQCQFSDAPTFGLKFFLTNNTITHFYSGGSLTVPSHEVTISTVYLFTHEASMNISCRALNLPDYCHCPAIHADRNFTDINGISFFHDGEGCYLDCFFDVMIPPKWSISDWNMIVNYSTATGEQGVLSLEMGYNHEVLATSIDEWSYVKFGGYNKYDVEEWWRKFHYHTEDMNGRQGFNLTYQWVPSCHCPKRTELVATSKPQIISSPNYPKAYCTSLRCTWVIKTDSDHKIKFDIQHLSLEDGSDFLRFVETGNSTVNNSRTFTGTRHHHIPTFEMVSPVIKFEVNGYYVRYNGFQIFYSKIDSPEVTAASLSQCECLSVFWAVFINILLLSATFISICIFKKHFATNRSDKRPFEDEDVMSYNDLLEADTIITE